MIYESKVSLVQMSVDELRHFYPQLRWRINAQLIKSCDSQLTVVWRRASFATRSNAASQPGTLSAKAADAAESARPQAATSDEGFPAKTPQMVPQ